jgi:hypothetical protein
MEKLESLIDSLPVVLSVVVLSLVLSIVGGEKALKPFLWLVLLSMLVLNSGKISAKLNTWKGVINP